MTEQEFKDMVTSKISTYSIEEAKEMLTIGNTLLAQGKILSPDTMTAIDMLEVIAHSAD